MPLDKSVEWMDAGNSDSLLEAANRVHEIQKYTGRNLGCLEECAMRQGFITREQAHQIGERLKKTNYGKYLLAL